MKLSDFFKAKSQVGLHSTYGLTPLGKTKAEEFSLHGPKWEVLASLNENGPSSVSEISEQVKAGPEKTKSILRGLVKSGYVRKVAQDS